VKTIQHIVFLMILAQASGCASIVSGTDQNLSFNSEPDDATVTVAGRVVGKTPLSVQIDKDENLAVTFEKDGYKTFSTQLSTTMDSWFWGNIVIGGVFGSTTDGMSGAMNEFSPDQYFVTLVPEKPFGISVEKTRQIKEIIVAFGDDIRLELVTGGEKVDLILEILDTKDNEKEIRTVVLNKLAKQNDNDLNFAKAIIEFYGVK